MEESDKLSLKRVELSLSKFNEVAIPHHLDLLRQHRANIIKYEECGSYGRVRVEQTHARRVTSQLRTLLSELQALRGRVRATDLPAFDASTQRSRDLTLRAIMDYLGVIESRCRAIVASSTLRRRLGTSPISANRLGPSGLDRESSSAAVVGSAVSSDSVGVLPLEADVDRSVAAPVDVVPLEADADTRPLIQLQINEQELSMKEREEMLRGWSALQSELRALHDVWQCAHAAALQQRDQVATVSAHVEEADLNVEAARTHLSTATRFRGGALALGGAALGALAGGPAGVLLGLKAGAGVALAGGLLGYLGTRAALPCASAVTPAQAHSDVEHDKDE